MNELIDFTLSFFSIDPAGPAAREELCSRSCFPLSPALFQADETAPGLSKSGNPHTLALGGGQMGHRCAGMEGGGLTPSSCPQGLC